MAANETRDKQTHNNEYTPIAIRVELMPYLESSPPNTLHLDGDQLAHD